MDMDMDMDMDSDSDSVEDANQKETDHIANLVELIDARYKMAHLYYDNSELVYDIDKRDPEGWYKYYGSVNNKLEYGNDYSNINKNLDNIKPHFDNMLVAHIIESIDFNYKLDFINYLYTYTGVTTGDRKWINAAKNYFEDVAVTTNSGTFLLYYSISKTRNITSRHILKLDEITQTWNIIADENRLRTFLKGKDYYRFFPKDITTSLKNLETGRILGFIGYEKTNTRLIFKTSVVSLSKKKGTSSARNIGARCDEANKAATIRNINVALGKPILVPEDFKKLKGSKQAVLQFELCVLYEIVLRIFNIYNKNNSVWFMTPEISVLRGFTSTKQMNK
jgi:hypothetical protein